MKKVEVNFSEQAYSDLRDLSERKTKDKGEVLSEALGLMQFLVEAKDKGDRILLEEGNYLREVILK